MSWRDIDLTARPARLTEFIEPRSDGDAAFTTPVHDDLVRSSGKM